MQAYVRLKQNESVRTYGIRATAVPYREQIEQQLAESQSVVVDFRGYDVTQSFIDELIGALILRKGRGVLSRLIFEHCTDEAKAVIRFVVQDRIKQVETAAA